MELFLDIETIARPGAEVLLPEPQAPSNYKDEAKIAKYIEEARAKQVEKMALDKRTCQIATIGFSAGDILSDAFDVSEPLFGDAERKLLIGFWAFVSGYAIHDRPLLVGFNIYNFDLPIIIRRSCLLGVKPTVQWQAHKYQQEPVLDLMQEWVGWDGFCSLKDVCRECGIPEPEGDGADVATMTPEERIAHCKSDVEAVRALYYKGKGWYW
jgi:hypothetical protein